MVAFPHAKLEFSMLVKSKYLTPFDLVYGSRARGNYRSASDLDLTMQGEKLQWADQQQIEQEIDELLLHSL